MTDTSSFFTPAKLSDHYGEVFYTTPSNSPFWRQLLATNPVESFTLTHIDEIPALLAFLKRHDEHLCAGYLSYDLGLQMQGLQGRHGSINSLAQFHAYDQWFEKENGHWKSPGGKAFPELNDIGQPDSHTLDLKLGMDRDLYAQNIKSILDYIKAGDFYQLNLTQVLSGSSPVSGRDLFHLLSAKHDAEHGCYLEVDGLNIHSLSPELFLHHQKGVLITEPIKGTRPRHSDPLLDEVRKDELLSSEKEQAELYMITDLLRNDLGRVSKIDSVHLDAVKEVKKLPRVWHTASRIQGTLRDDLTPIEALLSMFPGGSITGCPKERAMEAIDELEVSNRGIYTGSIGYLHPEGDMSFNIAIRTLVQRGSELRLGTGGGITIDSRWEQEWDELLVKASNFLDLHKDTGVRT